MAIFDNNKDDGEELPDPLHHAEEMPNPGDGDGEPGPGERLVSAEKAAKAAKDRARVKGQTVSFGGASKLFKNAGISARRNPKKALWLVGIVVVSVLGAMLVVGIMLEASKKAPVKKQTNVAGELRTGDETARKLNEFMDSQNADKAQETKILSDLQKTIDSQARTNAELNKRMEETAKAVDAAKQELYEKMERQRHGSDFVFVKPDLDTKNTTPNFEAGYKAIVATLSEEYLAGAVDVIEARQRADKFVRDQGYTGAEARAWRDKIMDKAGILHVGEVAEQQATEAEINTLPAELRPLFKKVHEHLESIGQFNGRVIPRPEEVKKIVDRELGAKAKAITDEQIARFATIARVRMENVSDPIERRLVDLQALCESKGIKPEDLLRLETGIWDYRDNLPGLTAGQHVSLIWTLARADRGTGSANIKPRLAPITTGDMAALNDVADKAVSAAMAKGTRTQAELLAQAGRAIDHYVMMERRSILPVQRNDVILGAVARGLGKGSTTAAATTPVAPGPNPVGEALQARRPTNPVEAPVSKAPVKAVEEPKVRLGQVELRKSQAGRAAWQIVTLVVARNRLDPSQPEGAASVAALWGLADHVGVDVWNECVGQPLSGKLWIDGILRRLSDQVLTTSRLGKLEVELDGVPAEVMPLVRSVYFGAMLGSYSEDKERAHDAYEIVMDRAKKGPVLTPSQIAQLQAISPAHVLQRIAYLSAIFKPENVPGSPERVQQIDDGIQKWMQERQITVQQITQHQRIAPEIRSTLAKEISENLYAVIPIVVSTSDDNRISIDMLHTVVSDQSMVFCTLSVAEAVMNQRFVTTLALPYLSQMDTNTGGINRLMSRLQTWAPVAIYELYKAKAPKITDTNYIDVAVSLVDALMDEAERVTVREVLHARVEPRIVRAGKDLDPEGVAGAIDQIHNASEQLVGRPPFKINDIDGWAIELQRIGMDYLRDHKPYDKGGPNGNKPPQQAGGNPGNAFPETKAPKSMTLPGTPIGTHDGAARSGRIRVLPGASFAAAYMLNGVALDIQGGTNKPVVLECQTHWDGPGGSSVEMPKLRVEGYAKPMAGSSRNSIELSKLVYVFPTNHEVTKSIQGFVVDNLVGMEGALAEWHVNADKVLPPALAAALLAGTSDALNNQNQQVTVGTGSTVTQTTNNTSTFQRALIGGTSDAAKLLQDYFHQFMEAVKPTVETPNGQPVTVVLFTTVSFPEITDEDWASIDLAKKGQGF